MEDCIFCKIVKGEIPSTKVYEDDRVFVFADINPISEGHVLVIPKAHAENVHEMSDEDLTAVILTGKKIANAMKEALNPLGVAFLQLNGKGVNQVVMHYHLHLIPRLEGAPEVKQTCWDLKPGDMGKIKEIADKISAAIK